MRPVEKLRPGDTCILEDGTAVIVKAEYKPYSRARDLLFSNLGPYCSYCERRLGGALTQLEHVQPQELYPLLINSWSNFLWGCAICNGSHNKDSKNVLLGQIHLPHLNNTFKSLVYKEAGVVQVNPTLTGASKAHAEELWKLVGYDEKTEDARMTFRREAWELAEYSLQEYEGGNRNLDKLIKAIKHNGSWSIWFTVFKDHDEVRKAMIDNFPGTAKNCFDPNNHYEPIDRNPNDPNDPV